MEFYIPSLFIMLLAAICLVLIVPRLSHIVLIVLCSLLLVWGIANHYTLFVREYHNMNWTNTASLLGPYVMLFVVIVISIGYIILIFLRKTVSSGSNEKMTIPPPDSATNYMTRGIGNSLSASGIADIDESALSKKI
jgi:hypothetical protein